MASRVDPAGGRVIPNNRIPLNDTTGAVLPGVSVEAASPALIEKTRERQHQVDFRVSKNVQVGRTRIQGMFDVFNVFNANAVLMQNNTFGSGGSRSCRAGWSSPARR
jgi:hypothetical protein